MSLFDLIQGAMGRPDPRAQLAAALNQAPGQAGSNTGPIPGAPPAPGAGAGGPSNPAGGGPPAAAGGAPQTPQQPPQPPQPQAYQSPPDLAQAYLQLAGRAQAEQQFNNGIAGMVASLYPGRTSGALVSALRGNVQDPSETFGTLMKLQMFNQQAQQLQAFQRAVPDIAKQLNMTPDEVLAAGPDAVHTALTANLPPEAMRNWTYAKRQWVQNHPEDPTGAEFEKQFPMSMAITGAIPGLSDTDRQRVNMLGDWQRQNPGQTPPTWLTNTTGFTNYQKDLGDAQGNFASFNQKSQETLDAIDRVKNNPKLGAALTLLSTTGGIGSNFLSQYGALDPDTKKAIDDIQLLSGQVYGDAFRSTGSRRTQQEVSAITEGLSKLGKTGYSANDYKNIVLQPIQDRIQTGMANNYGAAQQLDTMPDNLKGKVNPIYMPGGSQYGGQGGKGWYLQGMSKADADAAYTQMAPGTVYVDTDGKTKRKT